MSFAKFSNDFLMESFTLVDNLFINEHLPYCDEKQIKVYLYGLYLCSTPEKENSLETLSAVLDMEFPEIIDAYTYFEDAGLCQIISKQPLEVKYLSLKRAQQPPKKYKSEKWNDFNTELQQLFPERMLTPNEYNEYYSFLDSNKIEQDAMLMIVKYCINLKGNSIRYPYILTVAKNWVADGVKTVSDVETKLNEYDAQTEDMRQVLSAIGRKGGAELEEKQMLLKWLTSWGFELPAVLIAAKTLKGGKTFKKLDQKLDEFYRSTIFTAEEMTDYQKHREMLYTLAIKINKIIGVYYESLDHVIEVYTIPWTTKGFDEEALLKIAHHCFVGGIRTLDGLNNVINSFFAQGLLSVASINEFIEAQLREDIKIKKVIEASGRSRNVTNTDREYYRTWSAIWGFDDDIILYAAAESTGKTYSTSYINQLLSSWKARGIKTKAEAQKAGNAQPTTSSKPQNFTEREYTKDELQSVITTIDKLKNVDL
ncbi:MAG: DnaD domain protein [Clostridia bacterium]